MSTGLVALTDEELMLGCRGVVAERAKALINELARRYLERVAGFVFGMIGDRSTALDLAQETFIRVYKHRDGYKQVARFSTWLFTIARNLALNEIRNRKRRPTLAETGTESGEQGALKRVPARGAPPEEEVARGDLRALVRREILALGDPYREVVILCDLEERSYAEAAQILEVPIGTVRSRLSRGRDQLERRLRKHLR